MVTSAEVLLHEVHPDALWICVAPAFQVDVIRRAVELAIPFFVEPPGAVDYARARTYGRLVRDANLVSAVGFSRRYADVFLEAREYLGANPISLALGWWLCPSEEDVATPAVRLLWNDACILIDALRFFCGEVRRVQGLNADAGAPGGGLVAQLEFTAGTVGVFTCTAFRRPEPRVELELLGEGWSLGFRKELSTLCLAERDKMTILRCLNEPAAEQTTAFLAAVAAGSPAAVGGGYADVLPSLAICHAIEISAREKRPVELAELEDAA